MKTKTLIKQSSCFRDFEESNKTINLPPLEKINWNLVDSHAPLSISIPNWNRWNSPLPSADFVVITWTEAEWNALDFVFCDSFNDMPYYKSDNKNDWGKKWLQYGLGYENAKEKYNIPPDAPSNLDEAWGKIFMVSIDGKKVLLIKSNMHISTDGINIPLIEFTERIINECKPEVLFTIGTAGGARTNSKLGDVTITNSAKFQLTGEFKDKEFANKKFSCDWQPKLDIQSYVSPLLRSVPASKSFFDTLITELENKEKKPFTWNQLGNSDIEPRMLQNPKVSLYNKIPVLTTNGYEIANTSGNYSKYSAMEMDDAVIAMVSNKANQQFCIVRNISDPVVNKELSTRIQHDWSGEIYKTFGFYSSYNGAIATWGALKICCNKVLFN